MPKKIDEDEMALGVAARCWCDPETETNVMDPPLAKAFGKRVRGYLDMVEAAWGIIANASGGNWDRETDEWRIAAVRWRESYHEMLNKHGDPQL